jgi:hypothetical protein
VLIERKYNRKRCNYSFGAQLQSAMMRSPWCTVEEWWVEVRSVRVDDRSGQVLGEGRFRWEGVVEAASEGEAKMLGRDLAVRGEWREREGEEPISVYAYRVEESSSSSSSA